MYTEPLIQWEIFSKK